jgi:hypothetical protein
LDFQAIEIYNEKDLQGMFTTQDAQTGITWKSIADHIGTRSVEDVQRFAHAYFEQLKKTNVSSSGPVVFKKEPILQQEYNASQTSSVREGAGSSSGLSSSASSLQIAYGKEEKPEINESKLMLDSGMDSGMMIDGRKQPKLELDDTTSIPPMQPMSEEKLELEAAELDAFTVGAMDGAMDGLPLMIEPVTNSAWAQFADGAEDSPSMAAAAAAAAAAVPDANQYAVPPQAADGAGNTLRMGQDSVSAFRSGVSNVHHLDHGEIGGPIGGPIGGTIGGPAGHGEIVCQDDMGVVVRQRSPRSASLHDDPTAADPNANNAISGIIGSFRVVDPAPAAVNGNQSVASNSPGPGGGSRSVSRNSSASSAGSPLSSPMLGKKSPGGSMFTKKLMKTTVSACFRVSKFVFSDSCIASPAGKGASTVRWHPKWALDR